MMKRYALFILIIFNHFTLPAQTEKRELDVHLFDLDLYPFEVVKYSGKWGFALKPNYNKKNAINYFDRNFYYTTRKDTLLKNAWLAAPVYDKLEKWTYGAGTHFIAAFRDNATDLFTFKGELLGRSVGELRIESIGEDKAARIILLKAGNKWKWFYEGDFYKNNRMFYYRSPEYEKLEFIADTVAHTYSFKTGEPGSSAVFNEVGHLVFAETGYVLSEKEIAGIAKEEKKKAEAFMAKKSTEKAMKAKKKEETPEELSAKEKKRKMQKKITERDKMISYVFFADSSFFGLKTANGKVLIYPVMDVITIPYPADIDLQDDAINVSIQIKMYGQDYEIRSADFGGPDKLDCFRAGTAIKCQLLWNKAEQAYGFE